MYKNIYNMENIIFWKYFFMSYIQITVFPPREIIIKPWIIDQKQSSQKKNIDWLSQMKFIDTITWWIGLCGSLDKMALLA